MLEEAQKVHLIGIGGIGTSAIAQMFLEAGKQVSGSDKHSSRVTERLKEKGARIHIGEHRANFLSPEIDTVIYSVAIADENPEFEEAKRRGLPLFSYPEVLGLISEQYKTIAVSGTHGKTTTTAMLGRILGESKLNPTIIIGSFILEGGNNYVHGESDYFVVEADEYRRAFLNLTPFIVVITNLEADHLDYYKDFKDIQNAFGELGEKLPKEGFLICNANDPALVPVVKRTKARIVDYKTYLEKIPLLSLPGEHYRMDAAAAAAAAASLGASEGTIQKALETYTGTWRRFEHKGELKNGALIYDDYAHHPTEIKVTLKAAKEHFKNKRIVVLFQPHQYNRTKMLFDDFVHAFGSADRVYILPIEQIREKKDPNVSSEKLVAAMQNTHPQAKVLKTYDEAVAVLKNELKKDDVLFTMGATDVYKVGEQLLLLT